MEEKKNTDNGMTEISRLLIDFDALENYRDENGMPLLSMVRFYSLSGIEDAVKIRQTHFTDRQSLCEFWDGPAHQGDNQGWLVPFQHHHQGGLPPGMEGREKPRAPQERL